MANKRPLQVGYGAMAAISAASMVQLAAGGPLDIPLRISVGCFAIAIPFLAILFYAPIPHEEPPTGFTPTQRIYYTISVIVPRLAIGGLTALFWHFGWLFGVLFAVCCLFAWMIFKGWSTARDFFDEPQ
jgi:hypothetical protein